MRLGALLLFAAAVLLHSQEISHTTPPVVIHRAEPEYTQEALDAKLEGTAILALVIGADGVPSEIKVSRSLGKGLDEKAIECLKLWRFKPATSHGEPISTKATMEMNFRLPISH